MNEKIKAAMERAADRTARTWFSDPAMIREHRTTYFAAAIHWAEKYGAWCRADERAQQAEHYRDEHPSAERQASRLRRHSDRLLAELVGECQHDYEPDVSLSTMSCAKCGEEAPRRKP